MARKIWTAADLEQMTPTERQQIFEASIITDLDEAPPSLVRRSRERVEKLIEEAEHPQSG